MVFRFLSRSGQARSAHSKHSVHWTINNLEPRLLLAADAGAAVAEVACSPIAEVGANSNAELNATCQPTEIVFVDGSVADLLDVSDPILRGAEVVLLDTNRDGVSQIRDQLQLRTGIEAIHIVSHGANGQLQLGATNLNQQSLGQHADSVRDWSNALTANADILLYGCDVAADSAGTRFLNEIARLTGADIAASNDRTSNSHLGGDWELEWQSGAIDASIALTPRAVNSFDRHLGIDVIAGGSTGDEIMELRIDGLVVNSWQVQGGADSGAFNTFSTNIDGVAPSRISVHFTNDLYQPDQGIDRNLRVDAIVVDGVRLESESSSVFSTGTWRPEDGIADGNGRGDYLHSDGFFQFAGDASSGGGSSINIYASGDTGDEQAQLLIDGEVVQTFNNVSTSGQVLSYEHTENVTADRIRVAFINDLFANGVDRNLNVDRITIDGQTFQTESPSVFATGVYVNGVGITSGNLQGETLHSNGYFQYDAEDTNSGQTGEVGFAVTQTTVNEDDGSVTIGFNRTNGTSGSAQAFYQTQNGTAVEGTDYAGNANGIVNFADGQDYAEITIPIFDNGDLDGDKSFQLSMFRVEGASQGEPRTSIITLVDDESGDGLIAYYDLNETGVGGPIVDSSGQGNNGTASGFPLSGPTGDSPNNSGAFQFDGVNDSIRIGTNESLRLTNGTYSQSIWIKPTSATNQFRGVIGHQVGSQAGTRYPFVYTYGDDIYAGFGTGGNTWKGAIAEDVIAIGEWNHVAVSFDGSEMNLFVNGQLVQTNSDFGGSRPTTAVAQLNIGRINNQFLGLIDEVRMYNRAISGSEVQSLSDNTDGNESTNGLIGYWNLDETAASGVIADSSGQGNFGTPIGFSPVLTGPTTDAPNTSSSNTGAFDFDGINDVIRIEENESLRLTEGRYSQSVWIKPTSNANVFRSVIGYQVGSQAGTRYPFIYTYGNDLYAGFGTGGNTWKGVVSQDTITVNAWNHVAVTFDGTEMQLFVNGELVETNDDFGGSLPTTAVAQFNIGQINNRFLGQIDEVRMYDRAISGSEVRNLIGDAELPPPNIIGFFTTEVLARGFSELTSLEQLPNGNFIVSERRGVIRLVNADGSTSSTPFLDINEIVNRVGNDRGIMSIAIPPDFATSRFLYIAYTYDPPEVQGRGGAGGPDGEGSRVARVSRFKVNESFTFADPNSEEVIVGKNSTYENIGNPNRRAELNDPRSGVDENGNYIPDFIASDELSHTIGDMEFGSDGALYISVGDGGSYGRVDPVNLRSLDINSLNGKILRVDPNTGLGLSDNPFFNGDPNSNASRVYSFGLRNPFRFALQPGTNEVFIADVGWQTWEEINTGRGKNFGWPVYEGFDLTTATRGNYASLPEVQAYLATNPDVTDPIYLRSHGQGGRAIVMGDFVQGGDFPEALQGAFLFTDIGDQVLRAGRLDADGNLFDTVPVSAALGFITDIMRMPDGSLFYVDFVGGSIGELKFNS